MLCSEALIIPVVFVCASDSSNIYHHCTGTAPSLHHHCMLQVSRSSVQCCRLCCTIACTITVPSRYHHCVINNRGMLSCFVLSHHCTITAPSLHVAGCCGPSETAGAMEQLWCSDGTITEPLLNRRLVPTYCTITAPSLHRHCTIRQRPSTPVQSPVGCTRFCHIRTTSVMDSPIIPLP